MSSAEKEVEELLHSGRITLTEATTLLEASRDKRDQLRVLTHPLEAASTPVVLWIGSVMAVCALALGALSVHFDGALDMHVASGNVPVLRRVLELLVAIPLPAAVLYIGLREKTAHSRWIDFVAAVSIARVPFVLGGAVLAVLGLPHTRLSFEIAPVRLALHLSLWLGALTWFVIVLYTGVKSASGLSGGRFVGTFALLVILSEALSKLALFAASQLV